jgi:hypothetical protein
MHTGGVVKATDVERLSKIFGADTRTLMIQLLPVAAWSAPTSLHPTQLC